MCDTVTHMQQKHIITGVVVIAIIAVISAATMITNDSNQAQTVSEPELVLQDTQANQATPNQGTLESANVLVESFEESDDSQSSQTIAYLDGSYQATGSYRSPGGGEEIEVSITLQDSVITQAEVVGFATLPASVRYQNLFISNFQDQVIGKSIDEVQLDVVSGSSLTPIGFNAAIAEIKAQATQ